MTVFNNLFHDSTVPKELVPTNQQISSLKFRLRDKIDQGADEVTRVDKYIDEHQYVPGMDPDKPFIYAAKNGIGSDEDPLYIGITALNWLAWVQRYDLQL